MFGLWDVGTEFVRLFEAEQVPTLAAQVHPAHYTSGFDCFIEVETVGIDSCGFEAGEYHVIGSCSTAIQSQGENKKIARKFQMWK